MSTYSVVMVPANHAQVPSAYGNKPWMVGSLQGTGLGWHVSTILQANEGSAWIFWSVKLPAAVPGEVVTAIRMQDGVDYKVGDGVGMTRIATTVTKFGRSAADFSGTGGGSVVTTTPGTGNGHNVDVTFPLSGFNSNDLIAGSLMVGIAAYANGADAAETRLGEYRHGALTWTVYTGATPPSGPPPGVDTQKLTPTPSNASPGVFAGQSFGTTKGEWFPYSGVFQYRLYFIWLITGPSTGVYFPTTGNQRLEFQRGYSYGTSNWWWSETGPVTVAPWATPGVYTLTCVFQDDMGQQYYLSTQLVVLPPNTSFPTEF